MSRYIDAEKILPYISRLLGAMPLAVLKIAETDGVDIVRCKECKHNYNTAINHGKMQPRCDFTDWKLTENDYCSRGERKESE